jgi:hypothetical protein
MKSTLSLLTMIVCLVASPLHVAAQERVPLAMAATGGKLADSPLSSWASLHLNATGRPSWHSRPPPIL